MKITMLTPSFPSYKGDVQSPFVYQLCKTMINLGHDVKIVCPSYTHNRRDLDIENNTKRFRYMWPKKFQTLTSEGGIPSSLKNSKWAKIQLPFFFLFFLLKSLRHTRNTEIIHAHWTLSGLVGVICKKIWRKKLIITTRESLLENYLKSPIMKKVFLFVYRNADYIASANENHPGIISSFGIPKEKTGTVLNGMRIDLFKIRDKKEVRNQLGIPLNRNVVLFVGWLIERKGVKYLFEAAKSLNKEGKDYLFYFVGDGALYEELSKKVKDENLGDNIKFVGRKEHTEIPLWMNACDIFVFPSLFEGRPNVVAEAMMCGAPVVATDINGIRNELIIDGQNGFMVPSEDSKSIQEKISYLFNNPKKLEEFSKKGKEFIDKKTYSWQDCAKKYSAIYGNLIS